MAYIMETNGLTKIYGSKAAAEDINIHIREGEIYGLIGRNGAGKTTIMRMISGLSNPTRGEYMLFGKSGNEMRKMLKKVGVLIEHPGLYPKFSARDNLKIKCIGMGVDYKSGYIDELLKIVGLESVSDKKAAGEFSLGMRQRLGIALALVGDPSMIILDEPINGLDPQGIVEVRHTLEKLRDEKGITIMVSSHILAELGKIADSYGIIHEGKLIDQFTTTELEEKCSQYITVKTNDNLKAVDIISGIGISGTKTDDEGNIRVYDTLDKSPVIAKAIVNAGLELHDLHSTNVSLEDYYLSVTGGTDNA